MALMSRLPEGPQSRELWRHCCCGCEGWGGGRGDLCHLLAPEVASFFHPKPSCSALARPRVKVSAAPSLTPFQLHWLLAIPYTGQVCFRLRVLALCFFGLEHCTHTKSFSPASRVLLTCHLCTEVPPTTFTGKAPSHH